MNLCSNHGILLWEIHRLENGYEMKIGLADFWKLRPIARKTGTRAVVLERYGLPFLIRRIRKRKIFVIGLPCCLAFLIAMSQFVWAIDFEGNHSLTDDVLMRFLEEQKTTFGIPKNQVDIEALEAKLRESFDVITWTSIRLDGTKLILQIRENDLPLDDAKQEENELLTELVNDASDLISNAEGIVYSVLTRQGIPQIREGDLVKKGDLLVSGAIPIYADDGTIRFYQYCQADADVYLDYGITIRERIDLNFEYKSYTGREKKNFFFSFLDRKYLIPLHRCSFPRFDTVTDMKQLCLFSQIYLPVFYGTEIHREYLPVEAVYHPEQARKLLEERLSKKFEILEEKGVQIIQKDVTIGTVDTACVLEAGLRVRGRIGTSRPIETQEEERQEQ